MAHTLSEARKTIQQVYEMFLGLHSAVYNFSNQRPYNAHYDLKRVEFSLKRMGKDGRFLAMENFLHLGSLELGKKLEGLIQKIKSENLTPDWADRELNPILNDLERYLPESSH